MNLILVAANLLAVVPVDVRVTSEFVTDRSGREILSPAIPRNGWSAFHVIVEGPALTQFKLWIGQNPEDAVQVELFRDGHRVETPYSSVVPPGASSIAFLMKLWVNRDAPVRRIKVEPELWASDRWLTYPMEVRIVEATVPPGDLPKQSWQQHFCGKGTALPFPQDLLLARTKADAEVRLAFEKALGKPIAQWCQDSVARKGDWYLNFRDWLLR